MKKKIIREIELNGEEKKQDNGYSEKQNFWTRLPLDYPRIPNKLPKIVEENRVLEETTQNLIQEFCKGKEISSVVVLSTALIILLQRYIQEEEIIIFSQGNNSLPLTFPIKFRESSNGNEIIEKIKIHLEKEEKSYFIFKFFNLQESLKILENPTKIKDLNQSNLVIKISNFEIIWEYNASIISKDSIESLANHFENILVAINNNPQQPISKISFLDEREKQQQLIDWNNTSQEYPKEKCIHELIAAQAKKTPSKIALQYQNESLTYQELDFQANQLAHFLHKKGVKKETFVGICVQRKIKMVVGLLGIMKAGGCYIPLDPAFPSERLTYMLKNAGIKVLLTDSSITQDWTYDDYKLINLEKDWDKISLESNETPNNTITSDNLAYTIYTSGSTGKPKGVQINHKSVVNFLWSMKKKPGINSTDTLLAVTTICFDIAALEIYLPLIVGAKVVIASREDVVSGQTLAEMITSYDVTIMQATPTTWYLILAAGWMGKPRFKILCGGEAFPCDLAQKLLTKAETVWNLYGPTETTIWSTVYQVRKKDNYSQELPELIGKPINNTKSYILDKFLQPIPVGAIGELYLGGDGLARGYYNLSQLTKERFIPNPFVAEEKIYKTGDLVKYHLDGNIEYLGRLDNQVKIRGYRIELGEIEALLNSHSRVERSVVVAQNLSINYEENKQLAAYIVPKSDIAIQEKQIEQWQELWNLAYKEEKHKDIDPAFNISGWKDSYTGAEIPVEEMKEWVDGTVERILNCKPQRILEIGCGTGLLFFRLAKYCNYYCGSDIASEALHYIQTHWEKESNNHCELELRQAAADNFEGLEGQTFDTVIINSVVQLFPSIDYLLTVITKAIEKVTSEGCIFIGDIRNLDLMEAFHISTQLLTASDELSIKQLQQRIKKNIIQEGQLLISPDFFRALQEKFSQISQVEIQLRRGYYHNEMSKFRYDAILHLHKYNNTLNEPQWIDNNSFDIDKIKEILTTQSPNLLGIKNIPNPRLIPEITVLNNLKSEKSVKNLKELYKKVSTQGEDPEKYWKLAKKFGYTAYIDWSNDLDKYEVIFQKSNTTPLYTRKIDQKKQIESYANNPLVGQIATQLEPELRNYLKQHLPDYMLPTAFVTLKTMPLTPNGKINRKALPKPERNRPILNTILVKPTLEIEKQIAQIWQDILQISSIGINDNFFELGGNSLLLTQVYKKIMDLIEQPLSIVDLFQYPTIKALSQYLSQSESKNNHNYPSKRKEKKTAVKELRSRRNKHRKTK